jgi:TetR/AcrR family transcriptional regulator, transcriptional repressor for nem operon
VLTWRARFRDMLEEIAARYPPRDAVDLDALADMISSTVEGGIVLSKAVGQPSILPEQLILLRSYIRLLFEPTLPEPAPRP